MYFKVYQKLFNNYAKRRHADLPRILFNRYYDSAHKKNLRSSRLYWSGFGVLIVGLSYAAVPLYRVFCQVIESSRKRGGSCFIKHPALRDQF